jgi:hypothetical protein
MHGQTYEEHGYVLTPRDPASARHPITAILEDIRENRKAWRKAGIDVDRIRADERLRPYLARNSRRSDPD